jgi:hypothetical protein
MKRRRWLGDRLALPAGEPLTHRLDHLPLAWDDLERLGDVLAELRPHRGTAARAALRRQFQSMSGGNVAAWPRECCRVSSQIAEPTISQNPLRTLICQSSARPKGGSAKNIVYRKVK